MLLWPGLYVLVAMVTDKHIYWCWKLKDNCIVIIKYETVYNVGFTSARYMYTNFITKSYTCSIHIISNWYSWERFSLNIKQSKLWYGFTDIFKNTKFNTIIIPCQDFFFISDCLHFDCTPSLYRADTKGKCNMPHSMYFIIPAACSLTVVPPR